MNKHLTWRNLKTSLYVFFPYDINTNNKESNITLESLKDNYPLTYDYVKKNEKAFKARESGKAAKLKCWFAVGLEIDLKTLFDIVLD